LRGNLASLEKRCCAIERHFVPWRIEIRVSVRFPRP
jgi:hypothetical protein